MPKARYKTDYCAQGLLDDIKREVLMHKPDDYQTTKNLARLKVVVDQTIAEKSKDPEKRYPLQAFGQASSKTCSINR